MTTSKKIIIDRIVKSIKKRLENRGEYFHSTLNPEFDLHGFLNKMTLDQIKTWFYLLNQCSSSMYDKGSMRGTERGIEAALEDKKQAIKLLNRYRDYRKTALALKQNA